MEENMKLCLIGPFPPPINGTSKALDTLVHSEEFNRAFKCYKVDLSQTAVGQSGKFSAEKVRVTLGAAKRVRALKGRALVNQIILFPLANQIPTLTVFV